jgi:hypothetical protein
MMTKQQNKCDLGLDYTPVNIRAPCKEALKSPMNDFNSIDERYANLNIKPIEIVDTNVNVIEHLKNVNAANQSISNQINCSDTDSSMQIKCCTNPLRKKLYVPYDNMVKFSIRKFIVVVFIIKN